MTVSYSGNFVRLLLRWKGSIWRSVWKELTFFLLLYFGIRFSAPYMISYLDPDAKRDTKYNRYSFAIVVMQISLEPTTSSCANYSMITRGTFHSLFCWDFMWALLKISPEEHHQRHLNLWKGASPTKDIHGYGYLSVGDEFHRLGRPFRRCLLVAAL